MQSDPEPAPGALAPRPDTSSLAPTNLTLTGGAGLFDHSSRDPFAPSAGRWAGIVGLVIAIGVAVSFVVLNPSLQAGTATGTANQLGDVGSAAVLEPGSPAADGAALIATLPCVGCHTIPGIPGATGTVGPNLGGVASRPKIAGGAVNNSGPDDLKAWILNPPGLKPGTLMPNLGLTDDQATKIVAYLETLK